MTLRAILALALCLCLATGPAWADSARVAAANANLRAAPGPGNRVVATLARGTALEVLESSGEWLRVRVVQTRAEGWISRRLVETTGSGAVTSPPAARPSAPAAPAAPAAAATLSIDHRDVGCVVAGQYPKLDACFSPDASVGRGRVLFRAAGTDPWYYVDMSRDGPCYSAVLPKPKPQLKGFEYFVDVIDKAFAETHKPDRAPEQAFAPRVVRQQQDCDPARNIAAFLGRLARPVVVGVARDSSGHVLDAAAAKLLEGKALLTGFSPDGVIVSSTGAAPGTSAGTATAGGSAAGGAGGGLPTIAVVGGIAAAGALVAVVAKGGGGGSGSGGSGGTAGSGGSTAPGQGGQGGQSLTVTGQWVGLAAGGNRLTYQFGVEGALCTFRYDISMSLTQSGGGFSGNGSYTTRDAACSFPVAQDVIDTVLAGLSGQSGGFAVSGTANDAGAITLNVEGLVFNGTYNRTNMEVSSTTPPDPGLSQFMMTMKLVRQ
ncbi:MAG: hypothetical protein DMF81_20835 [Acidobacteria bacterium]|nr:MAG: hypothetical protein DMF81_20835 [Acidobacteriota bacterium]